MLFTMSVKITGIDHVVLNCADTEVTAQWYRRALGVDVDNYLPGRYALIVGAQKINLRPIDAQDWETASRPSVGSLDICLETADSIDEVLARWKRNGILLHEGPIERNGAKGKMMSVYSPDPDGNIIEVSHYR